MITEMNELQTLTKHISYGCKCKFDGRKHNSDQWQNNDKHRCDCKKHNIWEKVNVWNRATGRYENGKYLLNIMDDSAVICDKIIDAETEAKSNGEGKSNI